MEDITFGVLTVSDRCYARHTIDVSGSRLKEAIKNKTVIGCSVLKLSTIVPDEKSAIQEVIKQWCDKQVDVILSTGGTGLAPRDVTPNAVEPLLDVTIPGLTTLLINEGLKKTPFAALSRTISGIRGKTLIITLPGSCKGALEGLEAVAPLLTHSVNLIRDAKSEVEREHDHEYFNLRRRELLKSKVIINTNEESRVRKSKYPMISMSDTTVIFERKIGRLEVEPMFVEKAIGHILAEDIFALDSIPPKPTSLKDGYAVTEISEFPYFIIGESRPGKPYEGMLVDRQTVKVSTGSHVPTGGNFVIPVEDTYFRPDGQIKIDELDKIRCSEIRQPGSDLTIGDIVCPIGTHLEESEISLLASVGKSHVLVVRKPVVAILSTGDEIQDPWTELKDNKVRDSNKVGLKCLLTSWGYETIDLGIVTDKPDALLTALTNGFDHADVVITTGGMSMGERDIIKDVLIDDLQAHIHFGRVAMKPGKPTGFGSLVFKNNRKYWFGLPGNPASAFVTAPMIVLPALRVMSGWTSNISCKKIKAVLDEKVVPDKERLEYQRGILNFAPTQLSGFPSVRTTGRNAQRSSNIKGCSQANCFLELPPGDQELVPGTEIIVVLIK